ncbi:MAG: heavy-metal-associated domain-containing protein [Polaromonas sp.]
MEFDIPAMSCGHCASVISQTVKRVDPDAKVSVDLASKKVTVQTSEDRQAVAAALTEAGYPTH